MPGWLLSTLISIALKFGLPYLLTWLHKRFPNLPVSEAAKATISQLAQDLKQHDEQKKKMLLAAKEKLRSHYEGVAASAELKSDT